MRYLLATPLAALAVYTYHATSTPISAPVRQMLIASNHWHSGCPVPLSGLRVFTTTYWGFDKRTHTGQMVVNAHAVAPLTIVFRKLYAMRFPIRHMQLSDIYGKVPADGDVTASMECRNAVPSPCNGGSTSTGHWSMHAYGLAVDIDPEWNPHRHNVSGPVIFSAQPSQAGRQQEVAAGIAGTAFTPGQVAAVEAIRTVDGLQVFGWGGRWRSSHDAMHFEIRLTPAELRRGLSSLPGPTGQTDEAAGHATCTGCEADADAGEFAGEFEDASAWEDAAGHSRWGLYDQLALGWGQAEEAGND